MNSTALRTSLLHPAPQRRRPRWVDLNGPWEFAFDADDVGLREAWPRGDGPLPMVIQVPFCVESEASGLGILDAPPVVWYARNVALDPSWLGGRVLLRVGASDYITRTWANGAEFGVHRGGYSAFTVDVTPALRGPDLRLVLRVEDHPTPAQPRGKQATQPTPHNIWYRRCTGVWRDVWLEAVPQQYLRTFHFLADWKRRELTVQAQGHRVDDSDLRLRVSRDGVPCGEETLAMSGGRVRADLDLGRFGAIAPWSLEEPVLYDIELALGDDVIETYFGFRDVGIRGGRFCLNDRPVYLKLVLDQGYFPRTLYTEPDAAAVMREVELVRALGFNGVRKHQVSPSPRFRYCCDRLGVLILADMPGQTCDHPERGEPALDAEMRANFLDEYTEFIVANFNSPSVVGWTPYNESWGIFHVQDDPSVQAWVRRVVDLTRHLDPTRVVIGNDGWSSVETDLLALHHYAATGEELARVLAEWSLRRFDEFPPARPAVASGNPDTGAPLFLSEYGGVSFQAERRREGEWGYGPTEHEADAFRARYGSLQRALARHPTLAGYCYTQLTDCELEVNGLLTPEREPKLPLGELRAINDLASGPPVP